MTKQERRQIYKEMHYLLSDKKTIETGDGWAEICHLEKILVDDIANIRKKDK